MRLACGLAGLPDAGESTRFEVRGAAVETMVRAQPAAGRPARSLVLREAGAAASGRRVRAAMAPPGLPAFRCAGPGGIRAGTIRRGVPAPRAAGVGHALGGR